MAVVEHTIEFAAPIERVWRVSQDYSVRYEWDPFPESIAVVRGSMSPPAIGWLSPTSPAPQKSGWLA